MQIKMKENNTSEYFKKNVINSCKEIDQVEPKFLNLFE
jgi:hypothetical protein